MGKASKKTKKFQKNSLKGAIKKRKEDQFKKKVHEKREASRNKRAQLRAERKEQLSSQRQKEQDELNDFENFSDEEVDNTNLEQDVEDYLEKLATNEDFDDSSDLDDDDLSEPGSDDEEIARLAAEMDKDDDPNQNLKDQVEEHKFELEKLKEADPSFYEFLKENDQELLDFDEDVDEMDEDDEEEDEEEEELRPSLFFIICFCYLSNNLFILGTKKGREGGKIILTMEMIDSMIADIQETKSTKSMKKLVIAYKSCCHFVEGEEQTEDLPYKVPNSEVYNHLMVTGVAEFPLLFHAIFGVDESHKAEELELQKKKSKAKAKKKQTRLQTRIAKHERWGKLQSCVKSYLKSTIFLLDQMTDQKIISFILRRVNQDLLVYFACLPVLANKLIRVLNRFWSSSEETNRVLAFIAIRDLAILTPYPFIDVVLKVKNETFIKFLKREESNILLLLFNRVLI